MILEQRTEERQTHKDVPTRIDRLNRCLTVFPPSTDLCNDRSAALVARVLRILAEPRACPGAVGHSGKTACHDEVGN